MPCSEKANLKDLMEHYPIAAAMLMAQKVSHSPNAQMASIGQKALSLLVNEEDYNAALNELAKCSQL